MAAPELVEPGPGPDRNDVTLMSPQRQRCHIVAVCSGGLGPGNVRALAGWRRGLAWARYATASMEAAPIHDHGQARMPRSPAPQVTRHGAERLAWCLRDGRRV